MDLDRIKLSYNNVNNFFLYIFSYTTHQVVCINNINFQRKSVVVSLFSIAISGSKSTIYLFNNKVYFIIYLDNFQNYLPDNGVSGVDESEN